VRGRLLADRRRGGSRLLVICLALFVTLATTLPLESASPVLAADPLADARARQAQLQRTLSDQKAKIARLEATAAQLDRQLEVAEAELASLTAEYERVAGLLVQVRQQVEEITAQLALLAEQIAALDAELGLISAEIERRTEELAAREALLQDHLRTAYAQSQTSLLEILLAADSLDQVASQVGYLLTVSEQDQRLADEISALRGELAIHRATLREGRRSLSAVRRAAQEQEAILRQRQAELTEMEAELAGLKAAAEQLRAEQEAALNAAIANKAELEASYAENVKAFAAANALVAKLEAEAAARRRALEEARRRQAEEARRRQAERQSAVSRWGFAWPESGFRVTQEFGPTNFALEPPYTYKGVYYRHFHTGIDTAAGCGTKIRAIGAGVVVASGRPLWPYDSAYGVIIDHGSGISAWYWHLQARVVVRPGQGVVRGQLIGYEGSTGFSTGCHLHLAIHRAGWQNPRYYLP